MSKQTYVLRISTKSRITLPQQIVGYIPRREPPLNSDSIFLRTQGPESLPAHLFTGGRLRLQTMKTSRNKTHTLCMTQWHGPDLQWSEFCASSMKQTIAQFQTRIDQVESTLITLNSNEYNHIARHLIVNVSAVHPIQSNRPSKHKQAIFCTRQSGIKAGSTPAHGKRFCDRNHKRQTGGAALSAWRVERWL